MKRLLLIIAAWLVLGAVVNVAVAWGVAAWIQIDSRDLRLTRLSDGKLWLVLKCDGPGASRLFSVKCLDGWHGPQEIHDAVMLPAWSRLVRSQSSGGYFTTLEDARGWPSLAMSCEFKWDAAWKTTAWDGGIELRPKANRVGTVHKWRALPLRPIWPGFAVNTIFYAALLWFLICGPLALWRLARGFVRVKRGLCPKCAYPTGESSVCTECGRPLVKRTRTT